MAQRVLLPTRGIRPLPQAVPAARRPAARQRLARFPWALTFLAGLGLLLRAGPAFAAGFPPADGGLFHSMVEDLRAAHYTLPHTLSYNSAGIPFAYPPLPFYAAALLSDLTPLSTLDVLRLLPAAVSTATVVAFFVLARSFLRTDRAVLAATAAFALVPPSYMWMVMGGGLTRSFGMLFLVLAAHQARRLYGRSERGSLPLAALFSALTALSHPEMTWYLVVSLIVLGLAYGRSVAGLRRTAALSAAVFVLTAPWWATVIARHGAEPLLAASGSRPFVSAGAIGSLLRFGEAGEPLFPVVAFLGTMGTLVCLARRSFFLPAWFLAICVPVPWLFPPAASVPFALLAGVGLDRGLRPLLDRAGRASEGAVARPAGPPRWLLPGLLAGGLCVAALSSLLAARELLAPVPAAEREAMGWIAGRTPPSSRFAVLTGQHLDADRVSEWFPDLTGRVSLATVQGYEWQPANAFAERVARHSDLQECASRDTVCLDHWSRQMGAGFTHVYVSKSVPEELRARGYQECCQPLLASLLDDAGYALVYDGPGASVFARRDPLPEPSQ